MSKKEMYVWRTTVTCSDLCILNFSHVVSLNCMSPHFFLIFDKCTCIVQFYYYYQSIVAP